MYAENMLGGGLRRNRAVQIRVGPNRVSGSRVDPKISTRVRVGPTRARDCGSASTYNVRLGTNGFQRAEVYAIYGEYDLILRYKYVRHWNVRYKRYSHFYSFFGTSTYVRYSLLALVFFQWSRHSKRPN